MKTKLMAAVAAIAVMAATGAARAESADAEVTALKAQAAALKKQNQALENRLNKLEQKQEATAQKQDATDKQLAAAPRNFLAADLPILKGPIACDLPSPDGPLTFCGITLFGTIDGGLAWNAHGLPLNSKLYLGQQVLNKWATRSNFGFSPNGLSVSTLGVKGSTEILPGLSAVFWASTNVNPQSGQLANAAGSIIDNNGNNGPNFRNSSNFGDGSRGGQAFNDQIFVGLSSPTYGQLTFGRHRTLTTDLVGAYDPTGGASAFSLIGYSGTYVAGLGFTELGRWDDSLKYRVEYGPGRFAAMYKFADGNSGSNIGPAGLLCTGTNTPAPGCVANTAAAAVPRFFNTHNDGGQVDLGFSYAGLDLDGVLGYFNQGINIGSPLSPAQVSGIDQFVAASGLTTTSFGNPNANTIAVTAADITGGAIGAKYTWNQFKFFAGWAHEIFHNPKYQVGLGAQNDQGGYVISSVANNAFPHAKLLDTIWFGGKWAYDPKTDIVAVYEHVHQNDFGTTAQEATCGLARFALGPTGAPTAPRSGNCSGDINEGSIYVDYHFTKRFDVYGGVMVDAFSGGLASGFVNTINWAPTAGARFTF